MKLNLGKLECGDELPALMFAEEGQANEGNFSVALEMIEHASKAGADGIEFQLALADDLYINMDSGHSIYKKREFSFEQISQLVMNTKSHGMVFQVACLSPNLVKVCVDAKVDVLNINATDLTNPFILEAISDSGLPFWLSTLMGTLEEIDWAVNFLNGKQSGPFGILHGQHIMASESGVGVPPEMSQLDCISMFKERYGVVTGFVDHTPTIHMPAIAAAKGASIVYKHLSPYPDWKGPDWAVCLSPEEWRKSAEYLHYAGLTNGKSKELSQNEVSDRSIQRRSLYYAKNLPADHIIIKDDLVALRPGGKFNPMELSSIINKQLKESVQTLQPFDINNIKVKR